MDNTDSKSQYNLSLFDSSVNYYQLNKTGDLGNFYQPLQNLGDKKGLGDFTTKKLNFDSSRPVEMEIVDEYDGSQNIIINDDVNKPKLINSRMSVQENNTFLIPEHMGNSVNNVYNESELENTTNLLKLYQSIPSLTFNGLVDGGSFKCGSYIFYFKLADSDGNLTNVIQESSVVQVYVGQVNTTKVRMGLEDENAGKNISFTLTGIDAGFDYVRVFYERTSSGQAQGSGTGYWMINQNFIINNGKCDLFLTGGEEHIQITKSDLQTEFADIQSAKTSAINSNILFLGNISAYPQHFSELQQMAWTIYPTAEAENNQIGEISNNYALINGGGYYNTKNVYSFTGYWPDEYYRFGINFIYDNNLVSQTFNIQGVDLSNGNLSDVSEYMKSGELGDSNIEFWESSPENCIFKEKYKTNSKGVVRLPKVDLLNYQDENFKPRVLSIVFHLDLIKQWWKTKTGKDESLEDIFKYYHIKGFFFSRQKRIPTILGQGIVVGLTGKDFGSIPVIKNFEENYVTKSFLGKDRLLYPEGSEVIVQSKVDGETNVQTKALFIPDAELQEATYNQIFNGQEFALIKIGGISKFNNFNSRAYPITTEGKSAEEKYNISKITAVQRDVKILTDGENYFSTLAGDPHDPVKTSDVNYIWDKTRPQVLTKSTSLIRGQWGYYAGLSYGGYAYGSIVNIKAKGFADNEEEQNLLEFQKRFSDYSMYSAISDRFNISDLKDKITCFRGDCFPSLYTHKVMSNFADPEMPTNTKIIDPACWCNNYAVRCTATLTSTAHSNLTDDSSGWYIEEPEKTDKEKVVKVVVGILTAGIGVQGTAKDNTVTSQTKFANEVVQSFEVKIGKKDSDTEWDGPSSSSIPYQELIQNGWIRKVNPQEQENNSGINIKAIFKSSDNWELHGIASINRADINAVSYAQWITFPICSSMNLAFRDVDFSQATEESTFNKKRSFYPLEEMNIKNHMLESNVINIGTKKSISNIQKEAFQQIPFIKQEFFNRIYWSRPNVAQQFINSYRMIYNTQYHEYNKEWGAITKLVSINNALLVVFQHGLGLLPVNTTPSSAEEQIPYLAFISVLPTSVSVMSDSIGSMWKDSVIQSETTKIIYGVDTVSRKIWATDGTQLKLISDLKVNKFLNDYIDLSEFDFNEYVGHINVKTHYNAFKKDVIFTFYKDIVTKWAITEEVIKALQNDSDIKDLSNKDIIYSKNKLTVGNITYQIKKGAIYNEYNDYIIDINPAEWKQGTTWSLCYNEQTQTFTTFYDWYPVSSANVDNVFFSFDKDIIDQVLQNETEVIKLDKSADNFKIEGFYKEDINKHIIDKSFSNKTVEFYSIYPGAKINVVQSQKILVAYIKGDFYIQGNLNTEQIVYSKQLDSGYTLYIVCPKTADGSINATIVTENNLCIADPHAWKLDYLEKEGIIKKEPDNSITILDINLDYYRLRDSESQTMKLWKHGYAGLYDNQGKIKPTNWYGKQHEFNFEFIVSDTPTIQKVFNNLQLLSNKAEPGKFEYEVVGEGYEWFDYKPIVLWANKKVEENIFNDLDNAYKVILGKTSKDIQTTYPDFPDFIKEGDFYNPNGRIIKKLPYLKLKLTDKKGTPEKPRYTWEGDFDDFWNSYRKPTNNKDNDYSFNCNEVCLIEDDQLHEQRVHSEQLGNNMKKYGRVRGNMQYLEDAWKVEIRPIQFEWAYLDKEGNLKKQKVETRHRDKFLKVKIRYSGEDLAVIQAVYTFFELSYA